MKNIKIKRPVDRFEMKFTPKEEIKREAADLLRGHGWNHEKIGKAINKPPAWIKVAINR